VAIPIDVKPLVSVVVIARSISVPYGYMHNNQILIIVEVEEVIGYE
jgi:hypothetical protein